MVCLFGGASGGRAELLHLYDLGLKNVRVFDEKPGKLETVREMFPDSWSYRELGPAEACRDVLASGGCDVILCDGSRAAVTYIWEDLLPLALATASYQCVLRLTGEYLDERDLEHDADSARSIAAQLHGIEDLDVRPLAKRSGANGGTYWAIVGASGIGAEMVLSQYADSFNTGTDAHPYGEEHTIRLRDDLGQPPCNAVAGQCEAFVNAFRNVITRKERAPVFRAYTSARFARLPHRRIDSLNETAAAFDLQRFDNMDEVWDAARLSTSKRGTVNRKVGRAKRLGYYAKQFRRDNHIPDIFAVNTSMAQRGGKDMRNQFRRSIEDMGGYPTELKPLEAPVCPVHCQVHWGVFREVPGHMQGELEIGEELVGYINLFRYGNHAWYSTILGHGDHLQFGTMYLLHFAIVESLLNNDTGLEFIMYSGMNSRGFEGPLYKWKKRCLFEPKYIIYDDAGDWRRDAIWGEGA